MNQTSVTLLERLRQPGDREAWDRFVEIYVPVLQRWADVLVSDPNEADDLVQDVFVALNREMPRFEYREGGSFRAWLRTVTRNTFLERLRKQDRENRALAEAASPNACDPAADFWQNEFKSVLVRRALEIIRLDFDRVTVAAALAMIVDSEPAADVARSTGLTPAAVYAAKARVLRRLRDELGHLFD